MEKASLDLNKLALDRAPESRQANRSPIAQRRRWVVRYALPLLILFGFAALVILAAGRQFLPTKGVSVVPVVVKRGEVTKSGETLFQAPGWIEPRPTAIGVAAMTPGVIEELLVVAGQKLHRGDPVARLVSIDAELAVQQARNGLAIREGELKRANAELAAARVRLEHPVHLQVQLAEALGALARAETELAKVPFLIQAAEFDVSYARKQMENKRAASGAIPESAIALAEKNYAVAMANLQELQQRQPNLEREVSALDAKVEATRRQLELLVDETRQLLEAEAKVQAAEALRDEATLQLRLAELALDRTVVRAPIEGRVLRLVAAPGVRVTAPEGATVQGVGTVIEMFDPNRLQVRADVRLEDVPLVVPGQPVAIETASSPDVIRGRVLQITSEANIQKNTLEVKVELLSAPPMVSPEMLVTATFLAPDVESTSDEVGELERIFVPASLVQTVENEVYVWIVDVKSTARRRPIQTGKGSGDGLVEIKSGLQVTDKLISSETTELRDGMRITILGDDPKLGVN
ncbi:MAG TPA: HlyD family efflux transporter periplasmic adaptor subunit [Pirellulaceae bacterium]|nr:HlyD family efflux transporter periplasmic adaptor subunit [Pirellulaceae bacterium]HMO91322.1 HlyD family efflux transporter periplasmic adaptor subunit [Pirellulaceae bacterium]HMP70141.1 HlyD family efflux transporter periplasmic adaptor subunit [Pirellulaceae bacterium]